MWKRRPGEVALAPRRQHRTDPLDQLHQSARAGEESEPGQGNCPVRVRREAPAPPLTRAKSEPAVEVEQPSWWCLFLADVEEHLQPLLRQLEGFDAALEWQAL